MATYNPILLRERNGKPIVRCLPLGFSKTWIYYRAIRGGMQAFMSYPSDYHEGFEFKELKIIPGAPSFRDSILGLAPLYSSYLE